MYEYSFSRNRFTKNKKISTLKSSFNNRIFLLFFILFLLSINIKIKVLKKVLKILILHFLKLNENSMCGCVCANEKQGDRFEEKVYISK